MVQLCQQFLPCLEGFIGGYFGPLHWLFVFVAAGGKAPRRLPLCMLTFLLLLRPFFEGLIYHGCWKRKLGSDRGVKLQRWIWGFCFCWHSPIRSFFFSLNTRINGFFFFWSHISQHLFVYVQIFVSLCFSCSPKHCIHTRLIMVLGLPVLFCHMLPFAHVHGHNS